MSLRGAACGDPAIDCLEKRQTTAKEADAHARPAVLLSMTTDRNVDPHVGCAAHPPQDDKYSVIPKIRPLSMDCHSEQSETKRGNHPLFRSFRSVVVKETDSQAVDPHVAPAVLLRMTEETGAVLRMTYRCHSERSGTERGNRLLGAERITNSALRKIGKKKRQRPESEHAERYFITALCNITHL